MNITINPFLGFKYQTYQQKQIKQQNYKQNKIFCFENNNYRPHQISFGAKVRLLITLACSRHCKGCCNTYEEIMKHNKKAPLEAIKNYDEVMITGGEPSEYGGLKKVLATLRAQNPNGKLYLYSARVNKNLIEALPLVDGLHFTLHEGSTLKDIQDFKKLQKILLRKFANSGKSFRLYIDSRVEQPVTIYPSLFSRVESKKWLSEEELIANSKNFGLPSDEELIIMS